MIYVRQSKYDDFVKSRFNEIKQWIEEGFTETQIIKKLGIGRTAFERYKNTHKELKELITASIKKRDIVDVERLERALMKSAEGGWVKNGSRVLYVPPNSQSIIFALKKLKPTIYGDSAEGDNKPSELITAIENAAEDSHEQII